MHKTVTLTATSFATRQDLARFSAAVTRGSSVKAALAVGDNGVGAWGDITWKLSQPPTVALPPDIARRGLKVMVTLPLAGATPLLCTCLEKSRAGIIDLAPSALRALGLDPDADIMIPHTIVTLLD